MEIKRIDASKLTDFLKTGEEIVTIFSTHWCGYCRSLIKELEKCSVGFRIMEVDISDEDDSAWDDYEIGTVPTAILFKGGKEVARRPPNYDGLRVRDIRELMEKNP